MPPPVCSDAVGVGIVGELQRPAAARRFAAHSPRATCRRNCLPAGAAKGNGLDSRDRRVLTGVNAARCGFFLRSSRSPQAPCGTQSGARLPGRDRRPRPPPPPPRRCAGSTPATASVPARRRRATGQLHAARRPRRPERVLRRRPGGARRRCAAAGPRPTARSPPVAPRSRATSPSRPTTRARPATPPSAAIARRSCARSSTRAVACQRARDADAAAPDSLDPACALRPADAPRRAGAPPGACAWHRRRQHRQLYAAANLHCGRLLPRGCGLRRTRGVATSSISTSTWTPPASTTCPTRSTCACAPTAPTFSPPSRWSATPSSAPSSRSPPAAAGSGPYRC